MSDADDNLTTIPGTEIAPTAEKPEAPAETPAEPAEAAEAAPAKKAAAKKTAAKKTAAKKTAKKATKAVAKDEPSAEATDETPAEEPAGEAEPPRKRTRKSAKKAVAEPVEAPEETEDDAETAAAPMVLFQAPEAKPAKKAAKKTAKKKSAPKPAEDETPEDEEQEAAEAAEAPTEETEGEAAGDGESDGTARRRPRRRGGRRRRRSGGDAGDGDGAEGEESEASGEETDAEGDGDGDEGTSKRRRTRVRKPRNPEDEITSVSGSTRLEAKKQRRREGREAGRRRAPIVSEAEFLARREAVDRVMVIRQREDLTQIGVLEDKVLVEHYVARESQTSLIGNIYLGRVQNVLPSMEAAFIDIGKGRNAVLYAGEVNWSALGHPEGQPRKIESVLSSGQPVLVQVTKDPVGHKGARLTGQVSLPGRFLVYVPDGNTSGISRKLPDTERNRLKTLLKEIVPDTAGVIVRTAAEGASEEELTRDVERLTARWADIEAKVAAGKAPELLYGEPDLTLKVVRDLFTEDFSKLVVQGDDAWDLVDGYVSHVAPDLRERLERFEPGREGAQDGPQDLFAAYRIDEQIAKGLDRKVWLPSGGSLIIDRTEAMTVVDVNTGKFTGSGGNLEETVTKNNLEAAEEIVRQLRLRDIGGIIVVDFIDMVLESNRDLVLRRLVECLGRDRTRHQVAEVTSLGLVQMTRKRIGTGLLEAFSEECEHCKGRGVIVHERPVEPSNRGGGGGGGDEPRGRRGRGGRGRGRGGDSGGQAAPAAPPSPKDLAAIKPHPEPVADEVMGPDAEPVSEQPEAVETPAETPVETPVETPAETPAESATEPAEAEQPAAPVVVTSTRRRRAARPAGPPAAEAPETAETAEAPETGKPAEAAEAPEPAEASEPAAAGEPTETAEIAGTPEPAAASDVPEAPEAAETAADPDAETEGGTVLHVPIKKKGSRKR